MALLAAFPLGTNLAFAASFTINGNTTTAQTLGSGAGQTGIVNEGASLTVSGSTVAVTVSGNNATLTNLGTIGQTGSGRVIRDNTGVAGLMITNGSATNATASMKSSDADVIQMNKPSASVTLNNYGRMLSENASAGGAQAVDFNAIASGTNIVNNYAGGLIKATEADAIRPGVNGVINNWGSIQAVTTTGGSSDAIDAQENTGVNVVNHASGLIDGGRHGITGGAKDASVNFTTSVSNGGLIRGNNGAGINLDGFNAKQTATIINSGTINGRGVTGDGDGIDVDGLANITNTGTIRSLNAFSAGGAPAQSEAISIGGGTIINAGIIEGLVEPGNANAVGRGISLLGNDIESGPLAGTREAIYGNSIVINQTGGLIRGDSDSAIAVDGPASGYTVRVNNNAGATVMGGGATYAAIRTGADNDTIVNAGTISGASSGKAIDMGAGNNTLQVVGGAASILGNINGGSGGSNTMSIDPGTGGQFAYAGSISNFDSVEIRSGSVIFTGTSAYVGTTNISGGGKLTLDGANRLAADSGLALDGGTLEIANAVGIDGQTFGRLSLLDDSTIDLNFSALTINELDKVAAGKSLTIVDAVTGPTSGYAFRLTGNLLADADFLALIANTTINGRAAAFWFDGIYTDVGAVPEPGTLSMLFMGIMLLGATTLRSQRDKAR
ncbi:PEP-CTERM sorting domain-containing protein [Azoarcus sp. L1K30]|uniref:beta strand repeat-containing protein n=1 Tax=Azoarcus sp. L1K30 TaxID=2820277 RepID=UPI001B83C1F5|nr:PEP-CTERM sorting domain-containing protein [Azoarcus sp. L1K30]MBR0565909.1 PEP-CTERM sorting domain-containing protein [Azoarcus sp. L1K30]